MASSLSAASSSSTSIPLSSPTPSNSPLVESPPLKSMEPLPSQILTTAIDVAAEASTLESRRVPLKQRRCGWLKTLGYLTVCVGLFFGGKVARGYVSDLTSSSPPPQPVSLGYANFTSSSGASANSSAQLHPSLSALAFSSSALELSSSTAFKLDSSTIQDSSTAYELSQSSTALELEQSSTASAPQIIPTSAKATLSRLGVNVGTVSFTANGGSMSIGMSLSPPSSTHLNLYQAYSFNVYDSSSCPLTGSELHFNPNNVAHARPGQTRHAGDLGNMYPGITDAVGLSSSVLTFSGKYNIIGKVVAILSNKDDYVTQPTGNPNYGTEDRGSLCGVITANS